MPGGHEPPPLSTLHSSPAMGEEPPILLACLMACRQEETALLTHSLTGRLACLALARPGPGLSLSLSRVVASPSPSLHPTPTPPPPLFNRQTGADWGPLSEAQERQRGRGRGGQGPPPASSASAPLPPELFSWSLQGSLVARGSCRPVVGAPSRVPQER